MTEMSKSAIFTVDGVQQAYVSKVEDSVDSNDKVVKSLALGVVGYSDGATEGKVDFEGAIPLLGRELDFKDRAINHVTTRLGIRIAGKTLTLEGRFMNVTETSGVDDANGIRGQFQGAVVANV